MENEKDARTPDRGAPVEAVVMHSPWIDFSKQKPLDGQMCIVAAGAGRVAQHVALRWHAYTQEFIWSSAVEDLNIDPFPTECATHWMPWPDGPTA